MQVKLVIILSISQDPDNARNPDNTWETGKFK